MAIERSTTIEDIAITYRHLENCDPQTDMLFAEVDGQVIAYGRIWWDDLAEGIRLYHPFGFLHPDWRGKGLGSALWEAGEKPRPRTLPPVIPGICRSSSRWNPSPRKRRWWPCSKAAATSRSATRPTWCAT